MARHSSHQSPARLTKPDRIAAASLRRSGSPRRCPSQASPLQEAIYLGIQPELFTRPVKALLFHTLWGWQGSLEAASQYAQQVRL